MRLSVSLGETAEGRQSRQDRQRVRSQTPPKVSGRESTGNEESTLSLSHTLSSCRQRHYWGHLGSSETPIERLFLICRIGEDVVEGRIPLSAQLADQLIALYAQMTLGDEQEDLQVGESVERNLTHK